MKKLTAIVISLIFIYEGIGHSLPDNARNKSMLRKQLDFRTTADSTRYRDAVTDFEQIEVTLLNREIYVSGTVLSPRNTFSESFLQFIEKNKELFAGKRVLELGTGSGVLAIALARAGAIVLATDISPDAVEIAEKNISLEEQVVQDRTAIVLSDLYKNLAQYIGQGFDFVIFNHPIYTGAQLAQRPETFEAHAGIDFSVIRDAISGLPGILKPMGRAFFWALHGELDRQSVEYQDIEAVLWTDTRMQESLPNGWAAKPVDNFTSVELEQGDPSWVIRIIEIYNAQIRPIDLIRIEAAERQEIIDACL